MSILDDSTKQQSLDSKNLYSSIETLAKQCRHAWDSCQKIDLPGNYKTITKILMTGMGGSGLGARIIDAVYGDELKLPLVKINDYHLPAWADEKTLVICSSFSGTTEETISNAQEAIENKCPWIAIASGGGLIELAKRNGVPYYQIDPKYNPSKQPRMASGYLVIGQLAITARLGLIKFGEKDLADMETVMAEVLKKNARDIVTEKNGAKKLALKLKDRGVVLAAARHLLGAAHTIKNQMNENAKNFSALFDIPELNHHLMEGLAHPDQNKNFLYFVLINSNLYEKRIRERFEITEQIINKNQIESYTLNVTGPTEISQAFSLIQFGSLVNYYLSMLYEIDPAPIPWVDYFKLQLGQPLGKV